MPKLTLYLIVSVSGAVILALEILGTRILGPFYGVSLYLWSALISVTLLALSLGYFFGGRWADRAVSAPHVAAIFAAAGIWILLTPLLKAPVIAVADIIGLRFGVLVAATILFMPPLTLLGMVSPIAVKLRAGSLTEVGRSAGDLYAISTIAGVVAALLTGFVLIPRFGVTALTVLLGLTLVLVAIFLFMLNKKLAAAAACLLVAISLCLPSLLLKNYFYDKTALLDFRQSPYGEIAVVNDNGLKSLLIDNAPHTTVDAETGANMLRYGIALELIDDLTDLDNNMLIIGLGGGALFNYFTDLGWHVDAVEIDPVVVDFAIKYFDLRRDDSVFCGDGRQFLQNTSKRYDVILLDAFGSSAIPFHLTTTEAFQLIQSRLADDGLLAMNVISIGWRSPIVHSLAATLHQHFAHVLALPIHEPPDALTNVILLAANRAIDLPEDWLPRPADFVYDDYLHWQVVQKNHAWDNRFIPDFSKGEILTDDLNPIDLWAEAINYQTRREAMAYRKRGDLF